MADLREALEAAGRLLKGAYLDWASAGGPNQCQHGRAAGIPCPVCDKAMVDAALSAPPVEEAAPTDVFQRAIECIESINLTPPRQSDEFGPAGVSLLSGEEVKIIAIERLRKEKRLASRPNTSELGTLQSKQADSSSLAGKSAPTGEPREVTPLTREEAEKMAQQIFDRMTSIYDVDTEHDIQIIADALLSVAGSRFPRCPPCRHRSGEGKL